MASAWDRMWSMSSFSALMRAASMRARTFGRHVGISRRCWLRRGACGIPWRRRRRERIDLRQHAAVGEIPPYAQFRIVELSPIGLLATGDAWGEWGAEDFMSATGLNYVPQYIAHGFSWDALLPYYSLQGLPDVVGYILSAVIVDVLRSFAGAGKTVLFSTTTTSLSGSSPASSTYTPPTKRGTRWHSLCATALRACS